MSKFEIKSRFSAEVIFSCELSAEVAGQSYELRLGFAVKKALEAGANLTGAYLTGANLTDAYLAGANLTGANLAGANGEKLILVGKRPVLQIGPLGSRSALLGAYLTDHGVYIRTGCFLNTLERFREAVRETHGAMGLYAEEYNAAIVMIESHARLWTPAKTEVEAA